MAAERESFQSLRPAGELAGDPGAPAGRARFGGTELRHELPSLAPRGVGEILDTGVDILRARFVPCVLLLTPLWLPVMSLQYFAREMKSASEAIAFVLGIGLTFAVQMLGVGLVTVIVYGEMQGRRVRAAAATVAGLRRAPALLVVTMIIQPVLVAGTMCCIAPGILIAWLWSVAPAALVLERVGPIRALGRSAALTRGTFWRWAGVLVVQTALVAPLSMLTGVLSVPQVRTWLVARLSLSDSAYAVIDVVMGSVLSGVITAISSVLITVYYLDSRVRAEGFDLVMQLERLRERFARGEAERGGRAAGATP